MAFPIKSYSQIRDNILRDIINQNPDASIGKDSDHFIRASGTGAAIEGLYEHQQWIARQIFPSTSDPDVLEQRHANPRGIYRKAANKASGTITFSGTPGASVGVGTEAKALDGLSYLTTAADVIGAGGSVDIAAEAVVAGINGNQVAGASLTLTSAPSGVQSQASIMAMSGGTDIESDAELLARVLFRMRMPPAGGADHDYLAWAMAVPGVTDAYVFGQRRQANSVDVVIETAGGLPSQQLIDDVQAVLAAERPVTANVLAMAPSLITVDVDGSLTLDGTRLLADVVADIEAVLTAWFATLHVGDDVPVNRLIGLIMAVDGVADVVLNLPAANVTVLADATHSELAVLGSVAMA